jgi:hypothetical protein
MKKHLIYKAIALLFFSVFFSMGAYANTTGPISLEQIKQDVVGRTLKEPKDGYNQGYSSWRIEYQEIKSLHVTRIERDGADLIYHCVMDLRATGSTLRVSCQLRYVKEDYNWNLLYINTLEYNVVCTRRYNNCISSELASPMLALGDYIYITNQCDIDLIVGLRYYDGATWKKIEIKAKGNDSVRYGELKIEDYVVDYVELPL